MPDDDSTTPDAPNNPGDGGEGSRAGERDTDGIDHAELDGSPMLSNVLGNPDVWFEHAFPDGEGFADWLDGSGFYEELPDHANNWAARKIKWIAITDPSLLWNKVLTEASQRFLQEAYAESLPDDSLPDDDGQLTEAPDTGEPPEMLKSGWEQSSGYSVDVTMPDGSTVTLSTEEQVDAEGPWRRVIATISGVVVATAVIVAVVVVVGGGGDGDTSGATAGSPGGDATSSSAPLDSAGGGASSTSSRSVVIQPCLVVDQALASSLIGTTSPPEMRGDDRSKSCTYDGPAKASLSMFVTRNTAPVSGVFTGWRSVNDVTVGNRDVPIEIRDVSWTEDPEDGELRIRVFGTSRATVSLLAFVITSGTRGRVYVIVNAAGPYTAGAAMATSVETIAELLRDAILAAQP